MTTRLWATLVRILRRARGALWPRRATWRLLVGEVRGIARRSLHPVKLTAAVLVGSAIVALLSPTTPGPVLGAGWRFGVAIAIGLVASVVAHGLLQVERDRNATDDALHTLRVLVASVALALAGTIILAYLLAAITRQTGDVADIADVAGTGALDASLAVDGPLACSRWRSSPPRSAPGCGSPAPCSSSGSGC
jgi:uncharacterized membrane protein